MGRLTYSLLFYIISWVENPLTRPFTLCALHITEFYNIFILTSRLSKTKLYDSSQVTRQCDEMHCLGFGVQLPMGDARHHDPPSFSPKTLCPAYGSLFLPNRTTDNPRSSLLS